MKMLQMVMKPTNGEPMSTNSYLGCCDLSAWYNNLSNADQARIGTYNSIFKTLDSNNNPTNPTNQPIIPNLPNGQTMLDPTYYLPLIINQTNTISQAMGVYRF